MTLQIRPIHISAGRPINEALRPEFVDAGEYLLNAENVRPDIRGGLRTRWGFAAQTLARADGGNRAAGYKTFCHGLATCVIDGTSLDVYSPGGAKNWRAGRPPNLGVTRIPVASVGDPSLAQNSYEVLDVAYANGFYFVASVEQIALTGTPDWRIVVHVVERATRTTLKTFRHTTNVSLGVFVQCVAVGNTVVFAFQDINAAATITTFTMDATSAATIYAGFSAVGNIATDLAGSNYDWAICGLTTKYALAYTNSSGGAASLTVKTFTPSATVASSTSTTVNTTGAIVGVAIDGSEADIIYVAWSRSADQNVRVVGFDSSLNITSSSATVIAGTANGPRRLGVRRLSATTGVVTASFAGFVAAHSSWNAQAMRPFQTSGGATAATGAVVYNYGWHAWAQPFSQGSRSYAIQNISSDAPTTPAVVMNMGVFDMTSGTAMVGARPVAMPVVGLSPAPSDAVLSTNFHHSLAISSTVTAYAQWVRANGADTSIEIIELDGADTRRWQVAQHNGVTYLSGGLIYGFDGRQLFESGFTQPPAIAATLGGTGLTGTYRYIAIFEWTDAQGNVHWSEPSNILTVSPVNQTVTITVLSLTATWKDGADDDATMGQPSNSRRVRVKIFRTETNGPTYYLAGTALNDPTRDSTTFADSLADATLISRAKCYTQPGTLNTAQSRKTAPAAGSLTAYQDMLVALADDGRTVMTTAQRVVGEGAWWNPIFQYPITSGGTALAAQDGTLYAFTRTSIHAVAGESPSDNGGTGGLGAPRLLASDVGCVDPRSIVVTSLGIFFRSDRGIELLNRGQSVDFIGETVKQTTAAYPICTSAVLDASANVVYFELASAETSSQVSGTGRTLVFDLTLKGWVSKDRRKNSAGIADTPAQSSAMQWTGSAWRYSWLATDGRLYVEDRTLYSDSGAFVTPLWETPVVKLGLSTEQRLTDGMLLVEQGSAAGIKVECAYDWAAYSAGDDKTWTEAQALTKQQLPFRPKPLKRAKFRISATAPAVLGSGQGFTFVGLTFDVAPKTGSTTTLPHVATTDRR